MAFASNDSPARKWLDANRQMFSADGYPNEQQRQQLFDQIRTGRYVGVLMADNTVRTGVANFKGPRGWTLGGQDTNGAPLIATAATVVYVAGGKL